MAFCFGCYLLGVWWGWGGGREGQRSLVCPSFSTVHRQSWTTWPKKLPCSAQSAGSPQSWTFHPVSGDSTDHKRGPSCNRATDPDKVLGDSPDHRHQHGLRLQHRPQTSTWPWMATGATAINTDVGCSGTVVFNLVLKGSTGPAIAMATQISMTFSGHMVHGPHHGFRW